MSPTVIIAIGFGIVFFLVIIAIGAYMIFGMGSEAVRNLNGSIDEPRIWDRALTSSEINETYYSSLQKYNKTSWK